MLMMIALNACKKANISNGTNVERMSHIRVLLFIFEAHMIELWA